MKVAVVITLMMFFSIFLNPVMASGYGHGYGYYHHGHGHDHDYGRHHYGKHQGDYAGYALGGLILGGILGSALSQSQPGTIRYIDRYPYSYDSQTSFLRESNGDCYLINYNYNGKRVLTRVPDENCF